MVLPKGALCIFQTWSHLNTCPLPLAHWELGSRVPPSESGQGLVTALTKSAHPNQCSGTFKLSPPLSPFSLSLSLSLSAWLGAQPPYLKELRPCVEATRKAFQLRSQLTASTNHQTLEQMNLQMIPALSHRIFQLRARSHGAERRPPYWTLSEFLTDRNLWELITDDCHFKVIYHTPVDQEYTKNPFCPLPGLFNSLCWCPVTPPITNVPVFSTVSPVITPSSV